MSHGTFSFDRHVTTLPTTCVPGSALLNLVWHLVRHRSSSVQVLPHLHCLAGNELKDVHGSGSVFQVKMLQPFLQSAGSTLNSIQRSFTRTTIPLDAPRLQL